MTLWIIEPRDPLIVRDGRPFGPNPGARAATLAFPFPSTVVGGLRHKAGLDAQGVFDQSQISRVLELGIRGPLLVRLNDDDAIVEWLPPAPADALVLEQEPYDESNIRIQQLIPLPGTVLSNIPDGLQPIGQRNPLPNKASSRAPHFWRMKRFLDWLAAPGDTPAEPLTPLGVGKLATDARTHVSVQPESLTAREGALFQTQGLVFTEADRTRLALACFFEDNGASYTTPNFNGGLAALGGERRLMRWMHGATLPNAKVATAMREQIIAQRRARVVLLTPAVFVDGYRPQLEWVRGGATAKLYAALVQRAQVVSGWDMRADNGPGRSPGKPKPTRRLAAAGSVYFVSWETEQEATAWLDATWMQNVSDDAQDCRDGFGLAVYGVWAGK